MFGDALTPLQRRVLRLLAGSEPRWTLTGGGALAGFHLGHRGTRDLDLFFHGLRTLPETASLLERLVSAGLSVEAVTTSPSFRRVVVRDGVEELVVDLVADPTPLATPTEQRVLGDSSIQVDSLHEILVNKLCTALSRSEWRDLVDLRALLAAGGDLKRALADAARKDGGLSPSGLAWVLHTTPLAAIGRAAGASAREVEELEAWRDGFAHELARMDRPSA